MTIKKPALINNRFPEDIIPFLGTYIERREQDILNLRNSMATLDYASVKIIAHKIKGNGTGFGFPEISELASKLEVAAQAGNEVLVRHTMNELEQFIELAKLNFDKEIRAKGHA